jgi:hypothetical protein
MGSFNFRPGQKAECGKCGLEVTLFPDNGWKHTGKGKTNQTHDIKKIELRPMLDEQGKMVRDDNGSPRPSLISHQESTAFLKRLEDNKLRRTILGVAPPAPKEPPVIPEKEPFAESKYYVGTTANCRQCHKRVITIKDEATGKNIWIHKSGPAHVEPIDNDRIPYTTLKNAVKTAQQKKELEKRPVGPIVADPKTGKVTIPERRAPRKWNVETAQVDVLGEDRPAEVLQSDPAYIDASGKITSKNAAAFSKASPVQQGEILKGIKHIEEDHPWIQETSLIPEEQSTEAVMDEKGNIDKDKLAEVPKGDIFGTAGAPKFDINTGTFKKANAFQIPIRDSSWKQTEKGKGQGIDYQLRKRIQAFVDLAHEHKEKFDTQDKYEYEVYSTSGADVRKGAEPYIGVRRRLKYCSKCSPTILEDGTIPTGTTDPTARQLPNPKRKFFRPDLISLAPRTKPMVRTLPSGKVSVTDHPDVQGTVLKRVFRGMMKDAIKTRQEGFDAGKTEGK